MVISSRYASTCTKCQGDIKVGDKVVWAPGQKGVYHADTDVCKFTPPEHFQGLPRDAVQRLTPPPRDYSMKPIAEVMQAVGLKRPTLRLQGNGEGEVVLSLTRQGVAPGSVAVKVNDVFIGCVRPSGESTSLLKTPAREPLRKYLLETINSKDSLIQAAIAYAKLTNHCSFCGLELTNDYSVVVGYGPICAENWGLPHALNGTADKIRVPGMSDAKHMKLMQMLTGDDVEEHNNEVVEKLLDEDK